MDNILASAVARVPHIAALDELFASRLEALDLTPLLVYSIQTVPAAVLMDLARQFDLMGPGGWDLAVTEADKRALIQGAIELHKRKGTPWAVKESIKRVGYTDVQLIEHVSSGSVLYNGVYTYNASQTYGGGFWADFRAKITVPDSVPLSVTDRAKIAAMIEEYKNVRSRLVDITFGLVFTENPAYTDELEVAQDPVGDPEYLTPGAYYNGAVLYAGAVNYNKGQDPCTLKIYQNGILITTEIF